MAAYKLYIHESANEGIKRIMHEQVNKTREDLLDTSHTLDHRIHETRKRLKKVRAAVRLVRKATSKEMYQSLNKIFRDSGRKLAPMREAYVYIESLKEITKRIKDIDQRNQIADYVVFLNEHYQNELEKLSDGNITQEIKYDLETTHDLIDEMSFNDTGFDIFEGGLKKVYKRGRKAKDRALANPNDENLHEWRKRAKYLRHQLEILRNAWQDYTGSFAKLSHQLTDNLGVIHDLEQLIKILEQAFGGNNLFPAIYEVKKQMEKENIELARLRGNKIYHMKPGTFLCNISTFLEEEKKHKMNNEFQEV